MFISCFRSLPALLLLASLPALAQQPVITTVSPAANARAAGRTSPVRVTFSQPLTPASGAALKVHSAQRGGLRTAATPATVSSSTLTYTPPAARPWLPGETVFSTVTTQAASATGSLAKSKVVQFTAAAGGTGRGNFVAPATLPNPGVGTNPQRVVVGDVDGDGDLDLLTANIDANGTVSVRLNNGSGAFSGGSDFSVDAYPIDLVMSDVDGDGDLDVLVANGSNSVNVRLNNGAGTFSGGSNPSIGSSTNGIAMGDVDGDGDQDLLTANGDNTVGVRLNNGAGIFSGGSNPNIGNAAYSIVVGDVDGDGDLDFVTANLANDNASVRLNNGTGTFSGGADLPVGISPYSVALGDVDGDGDLDILTANFNNYPGTVTVCLNNGTGVFGVGTTVTTGNAPFRIALGDVDGDGDLDFATATYYDETVTIHFNDGTGGFSSGFAVALGAGNGPEAVALGDVDGDGDLDFVTANISNNTASVRLNQPPSITSFAPASGPAGTSVTLTGTGLSNATSLTVNGVTVTPTSVTATSLVFVVPAGASATQSITVNTPGSASAASTGFGVELRVSSSSPAANGRAATRTSPVRVTFSEPLAAGAGAALKVFSSQRGGLRTAAAPATVSGSTLTFTPSAYGFLPGETVAGVVTAAAQSSGGLALAAPVAFQFGVPTAAASGSFYPKTDYVVSGAPQQVVVGDVNGDGRLDIVTANKSGGSTGVSVLLGTGAGAFGPKLDFATGTSCYDVALGDVNNDGWLDLVTANGGSVSGAVGASVLLGTGTSALFGAATNLATGGKPYGVALGDLNGDGWLDIVTANTSSQANGVAGASVLLGTGGGSFGAAANLTVGHYPYDVALGDVNNDGNLDIVIASEGSTGSAGASILLGTGAGTFGAGTDFSTRQFPFNLTLGDINGDGWLDIVTANYASVKEVSVRLGTGLSGSAMFASTQNFTATTGSSYPYNVTLGDVNGDGLLDLVTANNGGTSGATGVSVLLGTGTPALFGAATTFATGATATGVALGDVSGDGRLDIVTANTNAAAGVSVLLAIPLEPVVASFAPASGPAGTDVTLTGNFQSLVTGVRFGTGALGSIVAQSATSLTVRVPVGAATGVLTLTTTAGYTGSTPTAFTYTPRPAGLQATLSPAGPLDACQPRTLTASAAVPPFNAGGTGFNNYVRSVAVQADGKVVAGGFFGSYNGAAAAPDNLLRLNADGSLDATFNAGGAGPDNPVQSVAVQADGRVLAGGDFSRYNGATAAPDRLLRLTATGALDATFNAGGSGFDGTVQSVVVQADGQILVGGDFQRYNGATVTTRLVRLDPTGAPDATFNAGGTGFDDVVQSIAVQPDGRVLVGGDFRRYNGVNVPYGLVRLNADGTLDATFNPGGAGASSTVQSIVVQADGLILIGGSFTTYNNSAAPDRLLRLTATGVLDATFNAGGSGFGSTVQSVAVQADGRVLVGGYFTSYNGSATPARLVRLNANGALDASYNAGGAGATGAANSYVQSLAIQADGRVLAGGSFTSYNGTNAANITRLNTDGSRHTAATPVSGASFSFLPGNTSTNPLVTSTPGTYSATASLGGETSPPSNAVVLTACPVPAISSTNPASGAAGTSVTLTGSNLAGATSVLVNGVSVVPTNVTATSLTFVVPTGASATPSLTVTAPIGTSAAYQNFGVELRLSGSSPMANTRAAARTGSAVQLTFSEAVAAASAGGVRVFSAQVGGRKAGTVSTTGATLRYQSTLAGRRADFQPGELVNVSVPASVQSVGGLAATPRVMQFIAAAGGTGRGNFLASGTIPNPAVGTNPQHVAVGDLDGDGDLDLLVANNNSPGTVSVRLNGGNATGSNTGQFANGPTVAVGSNPYDAAVGDVDGDGDLDFVTANYGPNGSGNTVSVCLNSGSGTFASAPTVPVGDGPQRVALADLDGDGNLDLLVANNYTGTVSVRLNDGTGTFTAPLINPDLAVGSYPIGLAVGDVDSDGDLDFVTANDDNTLSTMLNDGTALFVQAPVITAPGPIQGLALGDVNGDGSLDVLVANPLDNLVSVRLNDNAGAGTFGNATDVPLPASPLSLTLGDVDGDGDLDFTTANSDNTVSVRFNNGVGAFSGAANPTVGNYPQNVALADVDGDGDLDLLTANLNGNTVSVRFNAPLAPLPVELLSFAATASPNQASVHLSWATASERNSAHFEIERSPDGVAFTKLGEVAAAGSTTTRRDYAWLDGQLPAGAGPLYYRLRQVDQDGSIHYSPVRAVALAGAAWQVLPNPAPGQATVHGLPAGIAVRVYDALGRVVLTATAAPDGTVPLEHLPPGLYLVQAASQTQRLVAE